MTREFLKNLGLEDAAIDQILDENTRDTAKEKQRADTAKASLTEARNQLSAVQTELEALKKSGGDASALQQQLSDLQRKYDADTAALTAQIADRDYSDAIIRAIASKSLKFSSKSAEKAFIASLKDQKLELKDGQLTGIDDFIKTQREEDPDAFAPDKPAPRFLAPSGAGGAPEKPVSRAAQLAEEYHKNLYGTEKERD